MAPICRPTVAEELLKLIDDHQQIFVRLQRQLAGRMYQSQTAAPQRRVDKTGANGCHLMRVRWRRCEVGG